MEIFAAVRSVNFTQDVYRNIVSLRESADLFDDLSGDPQDSLLAQRVELSIKPEIYATHAPLIGRPFEEALFRDVIDYPFDHLQPSRFSSGRLGVWYGALTLETTIHETAFHWYRFLWNSGFEKERVTVERRVHKVFCDSHLLDFRALVRQWPALVADDYGFCHQIGDEMQRKQLPGLLTQSARHPEGESLAAFVPGILSNPRDYCYLTYLLVGDIIRVERRPGRAYLKLSCSGWQTGQVP